MFRKIGLRNFRTHRNTEIELGNVTLLIGNNNSGKSNLLAGIRHFARIATSSGALSVDDFFTHRHRLCGEDETMSFSCEWSDTGGDVEYSIELYEKRDGSPYHVGCREQIKLRLRDLDRLKDAQKVYSGHDTPCVQATLRNNVIGAPSLSFEEQQLSDRFFSSLSKCFGYHFQPSFLRGGVEREHPILEPEHLYIPSQLGYEGGNLHEMLRRLRDADQRSFERLIASLRRLNNTFHGIRWDKLLGTMWEFDFGHKGREQLEEFPPEMVSDGLLKAAAIALLTTASTPPALILLEEIENGINPGNIREFIGWLWQAAGDPENPSTQFVLTSHSPSVLQEFADNVNQVYNLRLQRNGFQSDVRNLATVLDVLIGIGTVEGEIEDVKGKKIVRVPRYQLPELWYNGTIG